MNRIGIVGGLGPEATIDYYRIIIQRSYEKFKGSAPEVIIYSLDLAKFTNLMKSFNKEKDNIINYLLKAVNTLHKAGASFVLIASNTPHIVFDEICEKSPVPLVSIVEETLKIVEEREIKRVGLFGTKFTMQADFYQKVFSIKDIDVLTPNDVEQNYINYKIYDELRFGNILNETREGFLTIIRRMIDRDNIEGLILGCTEIPLLLKDKEYYGIPFFNTTKIHAESALKYKL